MEENKGMAPKRQKMTTSRLPLPGPSRASVRTADDNGWQNLDGMILSVYLKNFMCHQEFRYAPTNCLNFLSGANGSGKSALMTAIVFALGGTARTSNRGTSNKGFIRTGQTQASVEIQLYNGGENTYRNELYGNKIIISRSVTVNGGGGYKIRNAEGKVVIERRAKEELDNILSAFGIQVSNPIALLNQDAAKSFLMKCDADKLYEFFMKATQLEDCKNEYNRAAEEARVAGSLLLDKEKNLLLLKAEARQWEKKFRLHQTFESRKDLISKKKGELAWALVKKSETKLKELQRESLKWEKKKNKCEEEVAACDIRIKENQQAIYNCYPCELQHNLEFLFCGTELLGWSMMQPTVAYTTWQTKIG